MYYYLIKYEIYDITLNEKKREFDCDVFVVCLAEPDAQSGNSCYTPRGN